MFSSISSVSPDTSSLHLQYQRVCQREREAAIRNASLLEDVAKLKSEMATLLSCEARSQRLSLLKEQYKSYVESCGLLTSHHAPPPHHAPPHALQPDARIPVPSPRQPDARIPVPSPRQPDALIPISQAEGNPRCLPPQHRYFPPQPRRLPAGHLSPTSAPEEPLQTRISNHSKHTPSTIPCHPKASLPLHNTAPSQPATGVDVPGQPATGVDVPGQPATGVDVPGQPATGVDVHGQPATVPSQPATGVDVPGQPATGVDVHGQPATVPGQPATVPGQPATGVDVHGQPATVPGQPATGVDVHGQPATGVDVHSQPLSDSVISEIASNSFVSLPGDKTSLLSDKPLPQNPVNPVSNNTSGNSSSSSLTHTSQMFSIPAPPTTTQPPPTTAQPPPTTTQPSPSPSVETSSFKQALSTGSLQQAPPTSTQSSPTGSLQQAPPTSDHMETSLFQESVTYGHLVQGSLGDGNTSSCSSQCSGSAADIEKELLQALEGGVVGSEGLPHTSGDPGGCGLVSEEGEELETSESLSVAYVPSSSTQSAISKTRAAANASLRRRLGLVSSEEESECDDYVMPHPSIPPNEEAEFDFL